MKRILVIDDKPSTLQEVEAGLTGADFEVTLAGSGMEGLREIEAGRFDLVISDRSMAGMSGNELARAIRAQVPAMPILLIAGEGGAEVDTTLFQAFLPEPFTMTQLLATIADLLPAAFDETAHQPAATFL